VSFDVANVITNVTPMLGFSSLTDLEASDWLQLVELYQWADEKVKRAAHAIGLFVETDTSTTTTAAQGTYNCPTGFIDMLALYAADARLRPSTARELMALDGTWPMTSGTPTRYSMDAGAPGTYVLYPFPVSAIAMLAVFLSYPAQIAQGSSVLAAPLPLQDWIGIAMVAEARRKESEAAMPEVAEHLDEVAALYEKAMLRYWGTGQ
jgi:hypothetical protein